MSEDIHDCVWKYGKITDTVIDRNGNSFCRMCKLPLIDVQLSDVALNWLRKRGYINKDTPL